MKVNDIDISQYNAIQSSVQIESSEFQSTYFWNDGALSPFFLQKKAKIKKIQLQFAVKGTDRDVIELNMSRILEKMSVPAVYQFDKIQHQFYCIAETPQIVAVSKRFKLMSATLYGYEFSDERRYEFEDEVTVTNIATAESPAVLQITSNIGLNSLTITGLTEDTITVTNIVKDSLLLIDSESGIITQDGINKYGDCDMWEFPVIKPGQNTVQLSSKCTAVLTYKPRYI